MRNIAVILAGGIGSRVGGNQPKQLLPLADGRSILEHAVEAFEQNACIDEICIVMHPDYVAHAEAMLQRNTWQKVAHIIPGGKERWESSVNAINYYQYALSAEDIAQTNLLFHDAARPYVSQDIITAVCSALRSHDAVTVAVPSTDTVYVVADERIAAIPPRQTIMRAQTPQAFRLPLIAEAYERALQQPDLCVTDDCGVVHAYMPKTPIHIVLGNEQNRKITFRDDL